MESVQKAADTVENVQRPLAIALPETIQDLMNQRKSKTKTSIIDQVETLHMSLYEKIEYKKLLDGIYTEQMVEGSEACDDIEAARMIRDEARKKGNGYIASQKLASIRTALRRVMVRYGISRSERRNG